MPAIYKTYNAKTDEFEQVKVEDIKTGQTVVAMFWSRNLKKHVTVPGASLMTMDASGELVTVDE